MAPTTILIKSCLFRLFVIVAGIHNLKEIFFVFKLNLSESRDKNSLFFILLNLYVFICALNEQIIKNLFIDLKHWTSDCKISVLRLFLDLFKYLISNSRNDALLELIV